MITSKITSKSAAIAFTGLSTQTSGGKLNLDRLLAYGRKINRQILNPERNLRIKRERMEVSLQFAKLAVNVPNAKFNEGPRDWQNMFIMTRFVNFYPGSFSYCLIFYYYWKKNTLLDRGLRYRGSIVIYIFI